MNSKMNPGKRRRNMNLLLSVTRSRYYKLRHEPSNWSEATSFGASLRPQSVLR